MMIQRRNRASLRWFSKNISLITLLWTFCTNPLSYHARVLISRGSHLTPFPYVRESHTRCCGTGFLRVRVWVMLKFPTGHPCPSLIWLAERFTGVMVVRLILSIDHVMYFQIPF